MMDIELLRRRDLLPAGSRVLCAVSGGADSMCLLHWLWQSRERLEIEVLAAHYEHGLRGEESLRDAAFVENWCRERGISCTVEHGDAAACAREKRLGVEEAARELRYAFLRRTARALGCARIATAHNADDNAETLLLNLCRGSGTAGLRGIPPVRENIVRPLLDCTRAEIEDYLQKNGVPHVEDSSNASDDYRRNLLRHRVLPVLRDLNPAFAEAAGRTAALLREDEECLAALAEDFLQKHWDGESLPAQELAALPRAIASRVLRKLRGRGLSMAHVEAALALAQGSGLAAVDLPGGRIRREQGRLYFSEGDTPPAISFAVCPGQRLELPEAGLTVEAAIGEYRQEINDLFKTYCFKYESICGNIVCTGRRPGDRLRPKGRGCTKSLKSLFLEAGLTQAQRDAALVFRDEAGILAVQGLAIAERAAPSPGDRVLHITVESIQEGAHA